MDINDVLDVLDDHGVDPDRVSPAVAEALSDMLAKVGPEAVGAFLRFAPTDYTDAAQFPPSVLGDFASTYVGTWDTADEFVESWIAVHHRPSFQCALLVDFLDLPRLFAALTAGVRGGGPYVAHVGHAVDIYLAGTVNPVLPAVSSTLLWEASRGAPPAAA